MEVGERAAEPQHMTSSNSLGILGMHVQVLDPGEIRDFGSPKSRYCRNSADSELVFYSRSRWTAMKIPIADDHAIMRRGLTYLRKGQPSTFSGRRRPWQHQRP